MRAVTALAGGRSQWTLRTLLELYAPAVLPYNLESWYSEPKSWAYLLAAASCSPLASVWLWRSQRRLAMACLAAAAWPALALIPMLPLRAALDLRRLGLILGFGLSLLAAALSAWLWSRRPRLLALATVATCVWLVPHAASAARVWGPTGSTYGDLLGAWITEQCVAQTQPDMQAVYAAQLLEREARSH